MTTLLLTHPSCLDHDQGAGHPEMPDRLRAVLAALGAGEFDALEWRQAPRAEIAQLERMHRGDYVSHVLGAVPAEGRVQLDPDTAMSPGSGEAALRAAGAVCAAVDAVVAGDGKNAFCAVRPPGHHAEPAHAMGFCLFNNVAIAAAQARAVHGLNRVAVVDFDVHHGNGTQHMFEADGDLFFGSTHQYPHYPGSGAAHEQGVGNIVNVPLAAGGGGAEFRAAMTGTILPALTDFAPDFILISAGFDAHAADPLAMLNFHEDDYAWATTEISRVADDCCDGRLVSTLEGGYDLGALGRSAAAHVRALMSA
jgi:acetoin utilization deacetylase AcuC-like enzyme